MKKEQLIAKRDALSPDQRRALINIAASHRRPLFCAIWAAAGPDNRDYRRRSIRILTGEPKDRPYSKCGVTVYQSLIEELTGIDFDACEYEGMELFQELYTLEAL